MGWKTKELYPYWNQTSEALSKLIYYPSWSPGEFSGNKEILSDGSI